MTYAQGGLIAATDYNNFVGPDPSTTAGQLNAVWATGYGQYGYGQTPVAQSAAAAGLVTATQWSTLINTLNSVYTHQTGAGTGISAVTTGSTIAYLSTLSTSLSTIYTNHLNFASQGTTATGTTYGDGLSAGNGVTYGESTVFTRTITFSSGDAARYFFNAGGQLNFVISSVTNNDGTSRSSDAATLIGTNLGGVSAFRATTNGGITGTGGTININTTGFGYYNLTTSPTTTQEITSTTSPYTGDFVKVYWASNGSNVSGHGDTGSVITLYLNYYSPATTSWNDTLNVTINNRIDIVYPETTNLSASWGTLSVA